MTSPLVSMLLTSNQYLLLNQNGEWKRQKTSSFECIVFPLLLLLMDLRLISSSNPNTPQRLTWQVLSQTGDTVLSTSTDALPGTWWPDLVLDLCYLIAGLDTWDIPEHSFESLPILEESTHTQRTIALGCARPWSRCQMRLTPFYVCPQDGQARPEARRCGGLESFYCKAWGCETTGTTYWKPSSSWDLITVSKNHSGTTTCPQRGRYIPSSLATCNTGQCNPVAFRFTPMGRQFKSWHKGRTWGLRFYQTGYDQGLTFTIKLKVEPLPNVVLMDQQPASPLPHTERLPL